MSMNQVLHIDALAPVVLHTAMSADREVKEMLGFAEQSMGLVERLKRIKKVHQMATEQRKENNAE
jgi:hypothetical protein